MQTAQDATAALLARCESTLGIPTPTSEPPRRVRQPSPEIESRLARALDLEEINARLEAIARAMTRLTTPIVRGKSRTSS